MKVFTDCTLFFHSYTLRVVGNGIKAQSTNPEVKVKEADPVINQIIDKLKHINQVRLILCTHLLYLHYIFSSFNAALTLVYVCISIPHFVRHTVW